MIEEFGLIPIKKISWQFYSNNIKCLIRINIGIKKILTYIF